MAEESLNPTHPPPPPPPQASPEPPADHVPPPPETEELPPPPSEAVAPPAVVEAATTTEEPPAAATPGTEKLPEVHESKSLAAMMETEQEQTPPPPPPPPPPSSLKEEVVVVVAETVKDKEVIADETESTKKVPQSLVSFKEESNKVSDLSDFERNALQELKQLIQEALNTDQLTATTTTEEPKPETEEEKPEKVTSLPEEVSIWGIPLLKDDRSDVVLLKFLRARDFKVKEAFTMIKNTIRWRKEFKIDELLDENLGDELDKVVFMHGFDREGHPVCYNVYGEFQNKDLYQKMFSDDEKRMKFLRWRIQFLERSIRKLDFRPGGISTIFQVNDLKNSPGPGKKELRLATKQALQLLQDNYPEFVAKQVFINVPWWYLAFYTMISPFMTQRTRSKFVFASPARSPEILFKYISPEHVPIQYGGLSVDYCDCNPEFTVDDPATEMIVKPGTKQNVEIIIYERCTIVWEVRVVGWEVSYGAEFAPDTEGAYTIIIQKPTKMAPTDEPVVSSSFKVSELGKLLLSVDNSTTKKKKLLYRFKVKPLTE